MRLSGEVLIGEERLARRVDELAAAIAAHTPDGTPLSVIALLDGAFIFCADLMRRLRMPVHLALVPLRPVAAGGDPARVRLPAGFPVAGADLLVVEDILDSGRTLTALRAHLDGLRPARTRIAVLLDKPTGRVVELMPDYVGFQVPDRWVVGYGLDSDGLYRNLPHISYVE